MLQDLLVDLLIGCQELTMDDAPHMEENDQYNSDFVLLFSASAMSETFTGCSPAWFPGRIQKFMSHHQ